MEALICKVIGIKELDRQRPILEIELIGMLKNGIDWLKKEVRIERKD